MLHLLRPLSALVLVTLCLKWPSTTYATHDRCRLPAPNDIYGCPYPRRVYYNTPQGQCVPYAYCGTAGSMYGFETWEECERVCGMQGDKMATYTEGFSSNNFNTGGRERDIALQCILVEGQLENFTKFATILLESLAPESSLYLYTLTHGSAGSTVAPSDETPEGTTKPSLPIPTDSAHIPKPDTPVPVTMPTEVSDTKLPEEATGNLATDPNSPEPMTTPPADSTAPPPPDDVPDYADLLENELKSLISNRPDTLVLEPSAATTIPGSGEEGKPSGEGNASGKEENASGEEGNMSGEEEGDKKPYVDEPLMKVHISVALTPQDESENKANELVVEQNYFAVETAKEKVFDYVSVGVVALALGMYLVVMGAIVGVAYALRKKKRNSQSNKRQDGPTLSEMVMIDLT